VAITTSFGEAQLRNFEVITRQEDHVMEESSLTGR
jgi:hypothetical protein